jgi:hypothetical protein
MKTAMGCFSASALMGLASAQGDYFPPSEPAATPTYSSPAATTTASGPAAPRTGIYGSVTQFNAAADNTVDDFTRRPVLINGQQYLAGWGGNTLANAAFAFQGIGFDWFGSATGGPGAPTALRAGLAQAGSWGGGLLLALAKTNSDAPADDNKVVLESDGFGLFGNFALGGSDIYGQLGVFTGFDDLAAGDDNYVKIGATEVKNSLYYVAVGWKKDATSEGTHALNAELAFDYSSLENESPGDDDATLTEVILSFAHGYILRQTQSYDVFLGSNSALVVRLGDFDVAPTDRTLYGISVSPNIAFQKNLMWGFEGFAGVSATLAWEMYEGTAESPIITTSTEGTNLLTTGGSMDLGLRWVKDNLAIEGRVAPTFLSTGPNFIGGGTGFLAEVGLALGI